MLITARVCAWLRSRPGFFIRILTGLAMLACVGMGAPCLTDLGAGDVTIRGVTLLVAPADPTDQLIRPRNAPVLLETKVEDGSGTDVTGDELFLDTALVGRLSGHNINQDISAPLGANLEIGTTTESAGDLIVGAPLLEPGNYTLDNLRLVDSSGTKILDADPSTLTIRVIGRVIVSNLSTRTLSLEEIDGQEVDPDGCALYEYRYELP